MKAITEDDAVAYMEDENLKKELANENDADACLVVEKV
jgi:hypothetical protein